MGALLNSFRMIVHLVKLLGRGSIHPLFRIPIGCNNYIYISKLLGDDFGAGAALFTTFTLSCESNP